MAIRDRLALTLGGWLGERIELEGPPTGWPLMARLRLPDRDLRIAVYLGQIGPSGRPGREAERRIQNPSAKHPISRHPERALLLLGLDLSDRAAPVVVLWNAHLRIGRTTRFSAFVPSNVIEAARSAGWHVHESTSGEHIVACTPDHLTDAVAHLLHEAESMVDDDNELDYEGLAAAMSALSQGEVPDTFPRSPSPFEADDIDWNTNQWLTYVCEIQHWLVLDHAMDISDGPPSAAEDLFVGLGSNAPSECFRVEDGTVSLSPAGFTRLDSRLSRAQSRRDSFQQDLADDFGIKQATRRWLARWEDEPEPPDISTVEVHAKVTTWTIKWFMDLADAGRLELNPSYQRDVVWATSDSQKLLDSVLRGIPLPSIILNQRRQSRVQEIVDGKQRLTAILRFMGLHPDGVEYARSKCTADATFDLYLSDYRKWRRMLGIRSPEERKHCLPFKLSTYKDDPLSHLSGRYYCEVTEERVNIQGNEEALEDVFKGPSDYKIPVILYQKTDLQQIHRVFGLYNKQGKQLNAEELRNAVYHHLDLTKLLLVLGGDSSRPDDLVPYAAEIRLHLVPETLHELQVGSSRFHRTKLASWVAAILLHAPNRGKKGITTPSTSGFIDSMLDAISEDHAHSMRNLENLQALARTMTQGAALLQQLNGEEYAFDKRFVSTKNDGIRWDDLPAVAAWTACTLAAVAGRTPDGGEDVAEPVRIFTAATPPLEKQQRDTQWAYLARTILALLTAMQVDLGELERRLKRRLGFTCLPTLREVAALKIKLE